MSVFDLELGEQCCNFQMEGVLFGICKGRATNQKGGASMKHIWMMSSLAINQFQEFHKKILSPITTSIGYSICS